MTALHITINNTAYTTTDDDQDAASLIRLAGRDPHREDLFFKGRDGVEHHIGDNQIIDLKDDSRFVTRHKIHFTIDGQPFTSFDDDQQAAAMLRLAGVDPGGYDLARVTNTGTPETFRDDQVVTIHDNDQFVTAKHVGGVA